MIARLSRLLALAMLAIMFARMLGAATQLSPVVDEQSHVARGVSLWRTGDARLQIGHPIGLNLWQTLPLALDPALRLPLDHESWRNAAWDRFGEEFLWRVNSNPDGIVFRSRVMVALLAVVLGALVFRWAADAIGPVAGALAAALFTLDPNFLAHGGLATTDVGVTLFMFAAVYALWRALRFDDGRWFAASGGLAGLALISKYAALALLPIFVILILMHARRAPSRRRLARHTLWLAALAAGVVLVTYAPRFDVYLSEFNFLVSNTATHPSFLLGQQSTEGWWYYFLVTFLLKTPVPTLVLIGWALVSDIAARRRRPVQSAGNPGGPGLTTWLLLPPAVYFAFSVASGFNVGYRHLLPALPFLFVYTSQVGRQVIAVEPTARVAAARVALGVLGLGLVLSSVGAHPNYIAYFNELAPAPHYVVLVDSNLDWGQSLKQLHDYLAANSTPRVKLSYFGTADPAAYDIAYDPLPRWPPPRQTDYVPADPAPGVYAISASNLQGILLDDPDAFDWFRHRTPDAIVGGSILIYHVAADPNPPQAVGLCNAPWTPVDEREVDALFGREGLRVVRFDCDRAWWWPGGPAWYVVPPAAAAPQTAPVVYRLRRRDGSTVFRVLRTDPPAPAPQDALRTPARFEGGLSLLGFDWSGDWTTGGPVEVRSVWRVDAPMRPPVSIFAHLLDETGVLVADADGLGVPAEVLQPGDVIVQRHIFDLPVQAVAGEFHVEFGFYRLDTLERYPMLVDGKPADQRVLAQPGGVVP